MAHNADLLAEANRLTSVVSANVKDLVQEWKEYSAFFKTDHDSNKYVVVERSVLNHLATEIMMLKEFLPSILESASAITQLTRIEKEKQSVIKERDLVVHRLETVITEFEKEKQDHFAAKCELEQLRQQLQSQSSYCTSLGLVCCTLLWRASQNEQAIQGIIAGTKTSEFLSLVSMTIRSFVDSYSDCLPEESSKEMQFVLSVCGIVTNIAASAYGRNYISNCPEGQALIQVSYEMLSLIPLSMKSVKLRSINQDGLVLLRDLREIFHTLVRLIREETSAVNKLHSLQLVQSLLLEPHIPPLVHQVEDAMLLELLQELTSTGQPQQSQQLTQLASEVILDIRSLTKAQHSQMSN